MMFPFSSRMGLLLVVLCSWSFPWASGQDYSDSQSGCCSFGDGCWPTTENVQTLSESLGLDLTRDLLWFSSVPFGDTYFGAPLFENGIDLDPVYVQPEDERVAEDGVCFIDFFSQYCAVSARSSPADGWSPSFVVWPTTIEHIQTAVRFANDHNLCISVAGTGHDFLNRHTNNEGMMIRTSLMKDIEFDVDDVKGFGHPEGSVKLGPGLVSAEIQEASMEHGKFISSGWEASLGIVGWTLGGGIGPFCPSKGLGVDNLLEAEVVMFDATVVTANAKSNPDLFWALKGGGGSTWGVIASLTIRTHDIPDDGIVLGSHTGIIPLCQDSVMAEDFVRRSLERAVHWRERWSAVSIFGVILVENLTPGCSVHMTWFFGFAFLGGIDDPEFDQVWSEHVSVFPELSKLVINEYAHPAILFQNLPTSFPTSRLPPEINEVPDAIGGIPYVFLDRQMIESGRPTQFLLHQIRECAEAGAGCQWATWLYQSGSNHIGSPNYLPGHTSISEGFRNHLVHLGIPKWTTLEQVEEYYALGDHSYFSESAYRMSNWQHRYWGNNYHRLLGIKQRYDPNNGFWCRHCVGSERRFSARGDGHHDHHH